MNRLVPILALVLAIPPLLLLGGCKRSVCGYYDQGFDPISKDWLAHRSLVPPNATICGHFKPDPEGQVDMNKVLQIDFERDDNPWVTIVAHLEGLGFTRTDQNLATADRQHVHLRKGDVKLDISTLRVKGRFRAVLILE